MRRVAVVALGMLAPVALAAQRQAIEDTGAVARFRSWAVVAESLAGFPALAHEATVRGRELRVYVGFGLLVPDKFIRLVDEGDGEPVRAARGIVWQSGLAAKLDHPGLDSAGLAIVAGQRAQETRLRQYVLARYDCVELRSSADDEGCLLREPRPRDWGAVLRGLDSLGVFDLRGKPTDLGARDGITLLVALRDTRGYRVYSYWTPEASDPDAKVRAAAEIVRRVSALFTP